MKRISGILGVLLILSSVSCKKGSHDEDACNGNTRRPVKLMSDDLASSVDTSLVVDITIEDLGDLDVPEVDRSTERLDLEKQVYRVRGTVEEVDRKRDGDYHILLKSGDKYLITEVPNPDCEYASESAYNSMFRIVYDFVETNSLEGKEVVITGVAFVDIDHHYSRKQADNNLELHPILKISF